MAKKKKTQAGGQGGSPTASPQQSPPPSPERAQSERLAQARLSRIRQSPSASPRTVARSPAGAEIAATLSEAEAELQALLRTSQELKQTGAPPSEQQQPQQPHGGSQSDEEFAATAKFLTPSSVGASAVAESPTYPAKWWDQGPLPENMPKPPPPTYTPSSPEQMVELAPAPQRASPTRLPVLPVTGAPVLAHRPLTIRLDADGAPLPLPKQAWAPSEVETQTSPPPAYPSEAETAQVVAATQLAERMESAAKAAEAQVAELTQYHRQHAETSDATVRAIQEDHDAKISIEVSMRESLRQQLELAVGNLTASEAATAASERAAAESEAAAAQATADLEAARSRLSVVEADLELTSSELSSAQATAETEAENAKKALAQLLQLTRSVSRSEEVEALVHRELDERLRGTRVEAARAVAAADAARNDTAEQLTVTRDEHAQFKSESESYRAAAEEELEKAYAASQEALHAAQADADSQLSVEVSMREALQGQLALAQRDADLNADLNEELNEELEQVRAQLSQAERELETVSCAAKTVQEAAAQASSQLTELSLARSESEQVLTRLESDKEDSDRRLSIETSKVAELILDAERYKTERDEAQGSARCVEAERDALAAERDALAAERDALRQDLQVRSSKATDLVSELKQAKTEKAQLMAQLQQSHYNSGAATKQAATELGQARARLSSMEMELSTATAAVVAEKEAATAANARFAELSSRINDRIQSSEQAEQTLGMQAEDAESRLSHARDRATTLARELEMAQDEAARAVAESRATMQQSVATAQQSAEEVFAVMSRLQVSESMEEQLEVHVEQLRTEMQEQQQQLEQSAERWRQRQLLDDAEQRVSQSGSVVTTGTPQRSSPNRSSPERSPEPPTPSLLVEMRQVDARYAPDAAASPNDSAMVYQGSPQIGDPPTPSLLVDLRMLDARYDTGPSPTLSAPSAADWSQSANESDSARSQSQQDKASPQEEPELVAPQGVKGEVQFVTLRERPELAGEVASWLFAEWGHLSDDPNNSSEKLRNRLVDKIKSTSEHDLPVVVVALEVLAPGDGSISAPSPRSPSVISLGSSHRSGSEMAVPIGTATLKLQELKEHLPNTQHWLGSVVVRPSSRGCGVGALLIAEVERRAAERGLTELHLATEELDGGLYARLGWEAAPIASNPIADRGDMVLVMKKRMMAVGLSRLSMAGVRHTPTRLRSRLGLETPERQPAPEPEPEPEPEPVPEPEPAVALQVDESTVEQEFENADEEEEEDSPLLQSSNPQRLWRKTRMAMSMVVGLPIAVGVACQAGQDDGTVVAKALPITPHRQHSVGAVQGASARTTHNGQQTSQPDESDAGSAVQEQAAVVTRDSETQMTPKRRRADPGSPPPPAAQGVIVPPPTGPDEGNTAPPGALSASAPQQNPADCLHCSRPWDRVWRGGHRTALGTFCSAVCAAKEEALRLHGAPDYFNSRSRAGHPTAVVATREVEAANSFWYGSDPGDPAGIASQQWEYVPTNRAWESAERANVLLEKARPRERPGRGGYSRYTQEGAEQREMGIIMASAKAAAAAAVEQLREHPGNAGYPPPQPPQQPHQPHQHQHQPPVDFDRFLAEDAGAVERPPPAAAAAAPLSELYPTTDLYPYEVQAREEMHRARLAQQQRRGGVNGHSSSRGKSALERVSEAERARRYSELAARLGGVNDPRHQHDAMMAVPRQWSESA